MARKLKAGVLEAFCKFTEGTEVPPVFAVWSGIALVSAVLGRDCFIDYDYYTIYPNLYVVLIGPSGVAKKSTPIKLITRIIKSVRPSVNILSQKMTPEGMIGALGGLYGKDGDTQVIPSAVGIVIVSELSTLIDKNSFKSGMIGILTDLYDAEDFEYLTRSRGRELVKNPCLSLIGGSTPHWIRECIPSVAIGGGFTSRIVFVYSKGSDQLVPRPKMSDVNKQRQRDIEHDMNEISKMRGVFATSDDAGALYDKEYIAFRRGSPLVADEGLGGYAGRRADILAKVAMVVSASRRDNRLITLDDMSVAIAFITKVEESMSKVMKAITSKEVGDIFEQIVRYIMRHKVVSRPDLIRRFRHKMTSAELNVMMQTLDEEGVVRVEVEGKSVRYVFTGK